VTDFSSLKTSGLSRNDADAGGHLHQSAVVADVPEGRGYQLHVDVADTLQSSPADNESRMLQRENQRVGTPLPLKLPFVRFLAASLSIGLA